MVPITAGAIVCSLLAIKLRNGDGRAVVGGSCGPKALLTVCESHGIRATEEELALLAGTDEEGTTMYGLAQAAKAKGLRPAGLELHFEALREMPMPAIAFMRHDHFVVLEWVDSSAVKLTDSGAERVVQRARFEKDWTGYVLAFNIGRRFNLNP